MNLCFARCGMLLFRLTRGRRPGCRKLRVAIEPMMGRQHCCNWNLLSPPRGLWSLFSSLTVGCTHGYMLPPHPWLNRNDDNSRTAFSENRKSKPRFGDFCRSFLPERTSRLVATCDQNHDVRKTT